MSIPVSILGTTVLWPTTGDTNYGNATTQYVQLVEAALDPIALLYNTNTGNVGSLVLDDSDNLVYRVNNGADIPIGSSGTVTSVGVSGSNGIGVGGSPITTSGTITLSLGNLTPTGDITLASTKNLFGDFSNATASNRTYLQSSTVNGNTFVGVKPNGTAVNAGFAIENNSTIGNNSFLGLNINATEAYIQSNVRGAGTQLPLAFRIGGSDKLTIATSGNATFANNLTVTGDLDSANASVNGNLVIVGSSRLVQADFSNATASNRTYLQSSTVNGNTFVGVRPNGTAVNSGFAIENDSTIGNNAFLGLNINATEAYIQSNVRGAGTQLPLAFRIGSDNLIEITTAGSVLINNAVLATSATDGFLYITTSAGRPTGTPTSHSGRQPIHIDTTNLKLWFYNGTAWQNSNTPQYEEFVAAGGQTVFNCAIRTLAKSGTKSYLQVFVNGVFQQEGAAKEYQVTGTTQITFNAGLVLNDDVVIYGFA